MFPQEAPKASTGIRKPRRAGALLFDRVPAAAIAGQDLSIEYDAASERLGPGNGDASTGNTQPSIYPVCTVLSTTCVSVWFHHCLCDLLDFFPPLCYKYIVYRILLQAQLVT